MFFEYKFSFPFKAWVRGCFLYFLLWLRCWYLVCTIYKSCAGDVGKVELSGWRRPCWAKGTRALPVTQSVEGVIRSFYLWCDLQRDIIKARMCLHKACSASSFHWRTDQQVPEGTGGVGAMAFRGTALRDSLLCLLPWSSSSLLTSFLNRTPWRAVWD